MAYPACGHPLRMLQPAVPLGSEPRRICHQRSGGRSGKGKKGSPSSGNNAKAKAKRAKARQPNEKITPASIFRKLIAFAKVYQIENEQDFREAARIYSEEAALIAQMRKRLKDEGLTVSAQKSRPEKRRFGRTAFLSESGEIRYDA